MDGGYGGFGNCFLLKLMKKICYVLLICTMALGGASVGLIVGAIKGQTTETGFVGGAGIGAMVGAITTIQLLDRMVISKAAFLYSLLNGKFYREWVTPAFLKAYRWPISSLEVNYFENSDIFEINGTEGLSEDVIKRLPTGRFCPSKNQRRCQVKNCIICLEDFKKEEFTRMLPSCGHTFHNKCIDEWLIRHGSCPLCRRGIYV